MILIVDGSNMAYRAHCANNKLTDPQGDPCGAIYGMLQTLRSLAYSSIGARAIVVTFDISKSSYRKEIYPEYKAHRKKDKEDPLQLMYYHQLPNLMKIVNLLVPVVTARDIEADDIISWLCQNTGDERILISSTDKDLYQLTSDRVSIVDAFKKKSRKDPTFEVNPDTFQALNGVSIAQYIDYRALMGDKSDNIKGIKGVGPVKAKKLIEEYGSISSMLDKKVALAVQHEKTLKLNLNLMKLDLHTKYPELFDQVLCELVKPFTQDIPIFSEVLQSLAFNHILNGIDTWLTPFKVLGTNPIINPHGRKEMDVLHTQEVSLLPS